MKRKQSRKAGNPRKIDIENGGHRSVVRNAELRAVEEEKTDGTLFSWARAELGQDPPKNAVSPCRDSALFGSIVVVREDVILVGWRKVRKAFEEIRKHFSLDALANQLVALLHRFPIALLDALLHLSLQHTAIIQIESCDIGSRRPNLDQAALPMRYLPSCPSQIITPISIIKSQHTFEL